MSDSSTVIAKEGTEERRAILSAGETTIFITTGEMEKVGFLRLEVFQAMDQRGLSAGEDTSTYFFYHKGMSHAWEIFCNDF